MRGNLARPCGQQADHHAQEEAEARPAGRCFPVRPHRRQQDHVRLTPATPPHAPRPRQLTPAGLWSCPRMLTASGAVILNLNERARAGG
jgi:hypothetical protein